MVYFILAVDILELLKRICFGLQKLPQLYGR